MANKGLRQIADKIWEGPYYETLGISYFGNDIMDKVSADLVHDIVTEVTDTQRLVIRAFTDLVHDLAQSFVRQWQHVAVLDPLWEPVVDGAIEVHPLLIPLAVEGRIPDQTPHGHGSAGSWRLRFVALAGGD